jgi:lipopolysaccharide/colanic/teichoic acid biosynthesis glycosyltransferase
MSPQAESLENIATASASGNAASQGSQGNLVLDEALFAKLLCLERKRAERSRKQFVLVLIDFKEAIPRGRSEKSLQKAVSALTGATRETDILGWYEKNAVLGVIFTEINGSDPHELITRLGEKVDSALQASFIPAVVERIRVSFHVFPEGWHEDRSGRPADITLYPDLAEDSNPRRAARILKRAMDIAGSGAALLVLSPLFLIIAVLVKLTSKGPILFRQERVGQFGKRFHILKFRSMYDRNDPRIHMEYVNSLIVGDKGVDIENGKGLKIYKLTNDPRVTPVGKLLRRTSLDEIPQFWNVFKGEMSLVGPRPPVQYEVLSYDIWHRRRILEAKPGITGLWQVSGRSSTTFDDMVRLAGAVISGDGAY